MKMGMSSSASQGVRHAPVSLLECSVPSIVMELFESGWENMRRTVMFASYSIGVEYSQLTCSDWRS